MYGRTVLLGATGSFHRCARIPKVDQEGVGGRSESESESGGRTKAGREKKGTASTDETRRRRGSLYYRSMVVHAHTAC